MTTQATHPQSTGEAMTSRAKELLVQILDAEWSVEKHSLWINADGVPKGPMHAADVRGWGFLTGRGHAHALDSESAFLIQKAIAHNIVDSHNAYRTLSSENAGLTERVKVLEAALEISHRNIISLRDVGLLHAMTEWLKLVENALARTTLTHGEGK